MIPIAMAVMGAGAIIKSYGQYMANLDQAEAERKNASFYREQADFARATGERQRAIFEDQTTQLFGDQMSGFAKSGMGPSSTSYFHAVQARQRAREEGSIQNEADMNVRLAMLRANQADKTAENLSSTTTNGMQFAGNMLGAASSMV